MSRPCSPLTVVSRPCSPLTVVSRPCSPVTVVSRPCSPLTVSRSFKTLRPCAVQCFSYTKDSDKANDAGLQVHNVKRPKPRRCGSPLLGVSDSLPSYGGMEANCKRRQVSSELKIPGAGVFGDDKHPLFDTWTWWYQDPKLSTSCSYLDALLRVFDFDTIEDFWVLHQHTVPPSQLGNGSDYCVFKKGIKPVWEDPANQNGGKIILRMAPGPRGYMVDNFWTELLLLLIGNVLESSEVVTGVVIQIRGNGDRLSIWLKTTKAEVIEPVRERILDVLNLPVSCRLVFVPFKDGAQPWIGHRSGKLIDGPKSQQSFSD